MQTGTVIQARRWQGPNGRTASLYSAQPWSTDEESKAWSIVSTGWTILWDDGTQGCGRPPFKTEAEARAFLERVG